MNTVFTPGRACVHPRQQAPHPRQYRVPADGHTARSLQPMALGGTRGAASSCEGAVARPCPHCIASSHVQFHRLSETRRGTAQPDASSRCGRAPASSSKTGAARMAARAVFVCQRTAVFVSAKGSAAAKARVLHAAGESVSCTGTSNTGEHPEANAAADTLACAGVSNASGAGCRDRLHPCPRDLEEAR